MQSDGDSMSEQDTAAPKAAKPVSAVGRIDDIIPGGYTAHRSNISGKRLLTRLTLSEVDEMLDALDIEYKEAIKGLPPGRKPCFSEWLTHDRDSFLAKQVLRIGLTSRQPNTALKAIGMLWEFNRAKPKQQMEISQPEPEMMVVSAEKLLETAFLALGVEPETGMKALQQIAPKRLPPAPPKKPN